MHTSKTWHAYFQDNARSLMPVAWELGPELTSDETAAITKSLQAFQAGESSEGKHLYRYAKDYAARTGDVDYLPALALFIAEEQRHARDLGRFLTLNNIPLVKTTFTDTVFRKLRHMFGGLEISIAVLITAEIIAKVYYWVLREATQSKILRTLCDQILRDELRHVQFQSEQLTKLRADRSVLGMLITRGMQRFLYLGAVSVVGVLHYRTIHRGGLSLWGWWRNCWREYNEAFVPAPEQLLHLPRPATSGRESF